MVPSYAAKLYRRAQRLVKEKSGGSLVEHTRSSFSGLQRNTSPVEIPTRKVY